MYALFFTETWNLNRSQELQFLGQAQPQSVFQLQIHLLYVIPGSPAAGIHSESWRTKDPHKMAELFVEHGSVAL
jgi:hypothetical protein